MDARRALRAMQRNQAGMILPLVLAFLGLGMLLITPTLGQGYTAISGTNTIEDKAEELHAADSGIEEGLFWLINGREDNLYWTWDEGTDSGSRQSYSINNATVSISVQPLPLLGPNFYRIDSVATSPRGTTTVLSQVWAAALPLADLDDLDSGETYPGDAFIEGDGTLNNSQGVEGNVTVTGDLTLDSSTFVGESVQVGGDLTLNSSSSVGGNICSSGPPGTTLTFKSWSDLNGELYVTVDTTCTIEVQGNADLHGGIWIDGSGTLTLKLMPGSVIQGDLHTTSLVTLNFSKDKGDRGDVVTWDGVRPEDACPPLPISGAAITTYEIL